MLAIAVFAAWLLLTGANQFNVVGKLVPLVNSLLMLPRWTFFAPRPGMHDYHLVYRTQDAQGNLSGFTEIPIRDSNRNAVSALWNHRKRVPKTIFDTTIALTLTMHLYNTHKVNLHAIKLTFQYLFLLHVASNFCHEKPGQNIQFVILRTNGFINEDAPSLMFVSDFHPYQLSA